MRLGALGRAFAGIRGRIAVLLVAGVVFQAAGFEVLITTLTRQWLYHEFEVRHRALAEQLAERAATPLLVSDTLQLADETRSAASETDIVAIAIYGLGDQRVAGWTGAPSLWRDLGPPTTTVASGAEPRMRTIAIPDGSALETTVPVLRHTPGLHRDEREAQEVFGLAGGDADSLASAIGMVRVVASTERIERAVATAARMGLLVLLAALALGVIAVGALAHVVLRPLREASILAGEIASGHLEHRLPVRSEDELGVLAASMNTMAAALDDARAAAEAEADRLRAAAEAVIAVAHEARISPDPRTILPVVAAQLRRLIDCEGVALAVPDADPATLRIAQLDPPGPWTGLAEGDRLALEVAFMVDAGEAARRLDLDADPSGVATALKADGYRVALLVPLSLDSGPPAILLLAARDSDGLEGTDAEWVAGLASHLSSALHSARLTESLQRAFTELERTRDFLVQSGMLRVAGEMASGVAHEFNNILGAVLGRAQLLRRQAEAGTMTAADLTHALEVIERVARDGGETVRRLRLFGRAGDGASGDVMDLETALHDATEFTRPRWENEALATGRSIEVLIDAEPGLWVSVPPHELREVLTNLILNSADALPEGGSIRLAAQVENERIRLSVDDDGTGMDEATRRRMFEPFFTTKKSSGTGLGMSVVYGIVQRRGGTIAVTSAPSCGTRIEIEFPRVAAPVAAAHTAPRPAEIPERTLDVLIVDDEEPVRELLVDMIQALGHRPFAFASGVEALSDFVPGRYDLVLTDLGMPGLTGWQFAETIRAMDEHVTLAFVTGWAEDLAEDALQSGSIDGVIAKPFTLETVERMLATAAARRAA